MQWALLISGSVITLSVLAFVFWSTRDTRKLSRNYMAAEKLALKLQRDLIQEKGERWNETLTLQHMLEQRDRQIVALKDHADDLERLIADSGGDELALKRLRAELSKTLAPGGGEDDEWLSDGPSPDSA